MSLKLLENNKGQSLWEVVVALAIASLVALGLVRLATISVKNSRFSGDQSKITALAQQKIAAIVDYKNKQPGLFWMGGNNFFPSGFIKEDYKEEGYCLRTAVTDVSSNLPSTTPDYTNAKMAKINVKVYWDEKSGGGTPQCYGLNYNHSLSFDTYVTN